MTGRVILNTSGLVPAMPNITFQLKPPSHTAPESTGGNSSALTIRVDQINLPGKGSSVYGLILEVIWYVNRVFVLRYDTQVHLPSNKGDSRLEHYTFKEGIF